MELKMLYFITGRDICRFRQQSVAYGPTPRPGCQYHRTNTGDFWFAVKFAVNAGIYLHSVVFFIKLFTPILKFVVCWF